MERGSGGEVSWRFHVQTLDRNGGSIHITSLATGVPERSIRQWRQERRLWQPENARQRRQQPQLPPEIAKLIDRLPKVTAWRGIDDPSVIRIEFVDPSDGSVHDTPYWERDNDHDDDQTQSIIP